MLSEQIVTSGPQSTPSESSANPSLLAPLQAGASSGILAIFQVANMVNKTNNEDKKQEKKLKNVGEYKKNGMG